MHHLVFLTWTACVAGLPAAGVAAASLPAAGLPAVGVAAGGDAWPGDPPRIGRPVPAAIQRGVKTSVELTGARLAEVSRVVFDAAAGLQVEIVERRPNRVRLYVTASADASLGERELRLVAAGGASNAVPLRICGVPVLREKAAKTITVPVVVCGVVGASGERDRFRFRARLGQQLRFDVAARRVRSALDPTMTIRDSKGRAVAWSRVAVHGDPELEFVAPRDGEFELVVHDVRFRGGKSSFYFLRARHESNDDRGLPGPLIPATNGSIAEASFDAKAKERTVTVPSTIHGCIGTPGEIDTYTFHVAAKTKLVFAVRRAGATSPLDPLLTLRDGNGKRLRVDDDGGEGSDARLEHVCPAGTYSASVRSLVGHGSDAHRYVLRIGPPVKPKGTFTIRFRPDTSRVRRGGYAKLWCEVIRRKGFADAVTLAFDDPPEGLLVDPVELNKENGWTSVFTIAAAVGTKLGVVPLRLTARGPNGKKIAIPEARGGDRKQAWLTVLEAAPYSVAPIGPPPESVRQSWQRERAELERKLGESTPELRDEQQAFVRRHRDGGHWITLDPVEFESKADTKHEKLRDGSILLRGRPPTRDTYTVVYKTSLLRIAAFRLDALPHPSLPSAGPGRNKPSGNFVLNRLTMTVAPATEPKKAVPVKLVKSKARFSQGGFAVARAFDDKGGTGWANHPESGKKNWAIFEPLEPIRGDGGIVLTVTLDQHYGGSHLLGRFRLSVAPKRLQAKSVTVPPQVQANLAAKNRTAKQTAEFAKWFRSVAPSLARLSSRLAQIETGHGNQPEIDRLQKKLAAETPERAAAREKWIARTAKHLVKWTQVSFQDMRSEQGVGFTREKNNVVRARRAVADKDNYILVGKTDLAKITAVRLETLPDKDLPAGGAGLAPSGNFVLSDISVRAWPVDDPQSVGHFALTSPAASFEQDGYPISKTIDGHHGSGWGVSGNANQPNFALWRLQTPIENAGGTVLRFYLEHQTGHKRHQLGRFRISVTGAKNPELAEGDLPIEVALTIMTPAAERTARQNKRLVAWHRKIAPELQVLREKITVLRAHQAVYPPKVTRGQRGILAVKVERRGGFAGEIKVTLEGFSSGREKDRTPRPFTRNFTAKPKTLAPDQTFAVLEFRARPKSETGTRAVVLRSEARIKGETVVEYSAPIPLTVRK